MQGYNSEQLLQKTFKIHLPSNEILNGIINKIIPEYDPKGQNNKTLKAYYTSEYINHMYTGFIHNFFIEFELPDGELLDNDLMYIINLIKNDARILGLYILDPYRGLKYASILKCDIMECTNVKTIYKIIGDQIDSTDFVTINLDCTSDIWIENQNIIHIGN